MAQSKLVGVSDMLVGVTPALELLFWSVAVSIVVTIAAGMLHYHFALHSTGDPRHARRRRRHTVQITSTICLCLTGLALYAATP